MHVIYLVCSRHTDRVWTFDSYADALHCACNHFNAAIVWHNGSWFANSVEHNQIKLGL